MSFFFCCCCFFLLPFIVVWCVFCSLSSSLFSCRLNQTHFVVFSFFCPAREQRIMYMSCTTDTLANNRLSQQRGKSPSVFSASVRQGTEVSTQLLPCASVISQSFARSPETRDSVPAPCETSPEPDVPAVTDTRTCWRPLVVSLARVTAQSLGGAGGRKKGAEQSRLD